MSIRRVYETTFIVNAALEDPDIDTVIAKVANYIENHGGNIQEVNKWGRRRLAYPINKKYNGFYVHIIFDSMPSTVPILERFLVLEDTVLRHLTLILASKVREYRERRAREEGRPIAPAFANPEEDTAKGVKAPAEPVQEAATEENEEKPAGE